MLMSAPAANTALIPAPRHLMRTSGACFEPTERQSGERRSAGSSDLDSVGWST